jgi:hypothetical protein
LDVEVTNVSPHGFWLLIDEEECFISFKIFPWFREASIAQLTNVKRPSPRHLYWPDLDVDLAVESIEHPEGYPLVTRPADCQTAEVSERAQRVGEKVQGLEERPLA